ncbi:iron-sulfur cluster assembly scaffold protein [Desulfonema magnum]|uniref:Iron-sulfur cluster assembly protein, NifU-like n=1 Tax=Desulfonema magnum TaxID=45655 RepID=A0A975GSR1_9BACT|nr:iron-sulfur cluster assembly scaffold protein [Desulfonema magnum]QTA92325.1 Iron-sulfur cluster assembly protein, NifU-like [Desulfonema magnum]
MTDPLDAFIDSLQEKIFDEARHTFGKSGFERWRNPRYRGRLDNFDVHARVTGDCGDTMEIFLKIDNDRVSEASYMTDGCGTSNVCGSFAAELAIDKTIDELADITGESILANLGHLADDEQHCAFLAAGTVQEAVRIHMTKPVVSCQ